MRTPRSNSVGELVGCTEHIGQALPIYVFACQRNTFHLLRRVAPCAHLLGALPSGMRMCRSKQVIVRATSHPIHGEVDPKGVVQLVQQLDKALFLRRQRRRMEGSRDTRVEVAATEGECL